jgi:Family of unknown function (DUF5763)
MRFDHRPEETPAGQAWPYGPCLYLGPQGQRCDRPAGEDGFCTRHSPEHAVDRRRIAKQVVAFLLLALGLLWPLLHDFLRQISGWIKK